VKQECLKLMPEGRDRWHVIW